MVGHYLIFNKTCREALSAYKKAFEAKIAEIIKYGDMPPNPNFPISEKDKNLILHARIQINGEELMCADTTEGTQGGSNMYVTITTTNAEFVQKAWNILKQDGIIYMELTESFFAALHGSLRDRFGINWMFFVVK